MIRSPTVMLAALMASSVCLGSRARGARDICEEDSLFRVTMVTSVSIPINDPQTDLVGPMRPERDTLERRTKVYNFLVEEYGLEFFDPNVPLWNAPQLFIQDGIPKAHVLSSGFPPDYNVIGFDVREGSGSNQFGGKFPLTNLQLEHDMILIMNLNGTTIQAHGRYGGENGADLPANSFFDFPEYDLVARLSDGTDKVLTSFEGKMLTTANAIGALPINMQLESEIWGAGSNLGMSLASEDHYELRTVITFPAELPSPSADNSQASTEPRNGCRVRDSVAAFEAEHDHEEL